MQLSARPLRSEELDEKIPHIFIQAAVTKLARIKFRHIKTTMDRTTLQRNCRSFFFFFLKLCGLSLKYSNSVIRHSNQVAKFCTSQLASFCQRLSSMQEVRLASHITCRDDKSSFCFWQRGSFGLKKSNTLRIIIFMLERNPGELLSLSNCTTSV